uniref:Uncharacterized protein n=1 Tax=Strongyloides papillosus TaxID=174720 RepID=A0A0N5CIS2_STREA
MEFVNNFLKKVNKIDIPKDPNCGTVDSGHHNFRRDFVRSSHVTVLNGNVKLTCVLDINAIVYSIIINIKNTP